jgi:hypothetical protein
MTPFQDDRMHGRFKGALATRPASQKFGVMRVVASGNKFHARHNDSRGATGFEDATDFFEKVPGLGRGHMFDHVFGEYKAQGFVREWKRKTYIHLDIVVSPTR